MANKFQKSVLERLEQEAARQKKEEKAKLKDSIKEPSETTTENIAEELKPEAAGIAPPAAEEESALKTAAPQAMQENKTAPAIPDIGEYLRRDNQRLAKNKTFYLDSDVIAAIKKTAKAQSVTDSKLVNDILRRVLGLS